MRLSLVVILPICLAGLATCWAAEEQNPQVEAATADAIEALKRQVVTAHVSPDLTVEDLLERVGGGDEMDKTLRGAERIGGARWLGDQAVQVRMSIDGSRVAAMLLAVVKAHPKQSPIPPEALQRQTKWWADRIFSATGTSTAAGEIGRLRPSPADRPWWKVLDADRRKALISARDNAVARTIQSIAPIQFAGDRTLGQALENPDAKKIVTDWLDGRPVESIRFDDDLTVHLSLAVRADELWPVLRSILQRQHEMPQPATEAEWDRIRDQVVERLKPAEGIGLVPPAGPATRPVADGAAIPAQPPAWATQQLQAQATSPASGSQLHTARKAEALALEKLRDQINQLSLGEGATIGIAAGKDPTIEQAVARALSRARPYQVDYGAKGAVTVYVSVRLSDLWGEITGQK